LATTELPKSASSPIHDNCVLQSEAISLEESKGQKGNKQLLEHGEHYWNKIYNMESMVSQACVAG
jgi:hypothetical protein